MKHEKVDFAYFSLNVYAISTIATSYMTACFCTLQLERYYKVITKKKHCLDFLVFYV